MGLVLGGAVGNLVDRIFRGPGLLDGKVVDFLRFDFWRSFPAFNVADSAITVGAVPGDPRRLRAQAGRRERRCRRSASEVPAALAGERADKVVAALAGVSRSLARRVLEAGGATFDGAPVSPRDRVAAGRALEVEVPAAPVLEPEVVAFGVRYEDARPGRGGQARRGGGAPRGGPRRRGHAGGRDPAALAGGAGGGRGGPLGHRAPSRPGHLGPAGGGTEPGCLAAAAPGDGPPRSGAHLPGPGARHPGGGHRDDRGASGP